MQRNTLTLRGLKQPFTLHLILWTRNFGRSQLGSANPRDVSRGSWGWRSRIPAASPLSVRGLVPPSLRLSVCPSVCLSPLSPPFSPTLPPKGVSSFGPPHTAWASHPVVSGWWLISKRQEVEGSVELRALPGPARLHLLRILLVGAVAWPARVQQVERQTPPVDGGGQGHAAKTCSGWGMLSRPPLESTFCHVDLRCLDCGDRRPGVDPALPLSHVTSDKLFSLSAPQSHHL